MLTGFVGGLAVGLLLAEGASPLGVSEGLSFGAAVSAGLGFSSAAATFAADAAFELTGVQFDNKVEVAFESNNNLRANVGLRLNITVITIQADYTFAEYPTATLGLGVSLR